MAVVFQRPTDQIQDEVEMIDEFEKDNHELLLLIQHVKEHSRAFLDY